MPVPTRVELPHSPPHACRLSIVVACYDERDCLPLFHDRAMAACQALVGQDYEIVFVDDGSKDSTWTIISQLAASNPCVVGVKLMRNHGHQLAASAGLAMSRGERVLLIDADLQDPPELVEQMWKVMDQGADVVYGRRTSRAGESWFKTKTASWFYRLLQRSTDVAIPLDTGDFRLMTRAVVDVLKAMPERQRFLRGMVSWIGGTQVALDYERHSRVAGQTKYPLRKMILFAIDAFTSFSIVPLRLAFWLGLSSSVIASLMLIYVLASWIGGTTVLGWTSMMAVTIFFSGVQLAVLGVIGEYLGRLVQESKQRPMFLIGAVIGRAAPSSLGDPIALKTTA
jgi:polyisoprenyl-phosphate glycosyltransferase